MKKMLPWFLFYALVLSACGYAQSQAVQLPEALIVLLGMGVLVAFTALGKLVLDRFGIDIQDRLAEIAAAVSAILVLLINYALALVPAAYDGWLNAFMAFLIVLLGGTGMFSLFFRKKSR